MLFGEYDEKLAREVGFEEGFEDGFAAGFTDGEMQKLIQLVCRKIVKEKSVEVIADELDEPVELIRKVYAAVETAGVDADLKTIYKSLQSME